MSLNCGKWRSIHRRVQSLKSKLQSRNAAFINGTIKALAVLLASQSRTLQITHEPRDQPAHFERLLLQRFEFCSRDRKSTRLNSSHEWISYAVFCLKKKKNNETKPPITTTYQ